MPSRKRVAPHDPDAGSAKKAYELVLPQLGDLAPSAIAAPNTDVQEAAAMAVGVARDVSAPAVRARFASLPKSEFDMTHLDALESAALAAWYARSALASAAVSATEAKLPASLVEHASQVKSRMLSVASYYFADHEKLAPEVADIRSGSGHQDLATDLTRLADLYEQQVDIVSADTKHYRASDAKDARTAARAILDALSSAQNADYKKWLDQSARTWTLLATHYAEVRAAGLFLFRNDGAADLFPTLVAAGRARPRAKNAPATPPAPAPPPPAPAPAGDGTPQPNA